MNTKINTQLLRALNAGKWSKALELLNSGADPTARTAKGLNGVLLMTQCAENQITPLFFTVFDLCLEKGCRLTDTTPHGNTVVHLCATHSKLLRHCLTYTPDCSGLNKYNETVLHMFARNSNPSQQLMRDLVRLGADINQKDKNKHSVFEVFSIYNFNGAKPLLRLIQLGAHPTRTEIEYGCVAALNTEDKYTIAYFEYAKQQGVNFNCDFDHVPLLAKAVHKGKVQTVEYLLSNGASIAQSTFDQPMGMAIQLYDNKNAAPMLDLLMAHGLDVNAVGSSAGSGAQTMLHRLMHHLCLRKFDQNHAQGLLAWLQKLLTCGADLNIGDEVGLTPLCLALTELGDEYPDISQESMPVQMYVNAILDTLLDHGADLHQTVGNGAGRTGPLNTLLRRCELTELFEHKVAERQNIVLHGHINTERTVGSKKKM